jgi:hypothetical protein
MQLIAQLKSLDTDRLTLDEAMVLLTQCRALKATWSQEDIEIPDWLSNASTRLEAEARDRARGELLRKKREIELKRDRLKTRDEQRQEADLELAAIEARLNPQGVKEPATA